MAEETIKMVSDSIDIYSQGSGSGGGGHCGSDVVDDFSSP